MFVLALVVVVLVVVVVRLQHSLETMREEIARLRRDASDTRWPAERLTALERRVDALGGVVAATDSAAADAAATSIPAVAPAYVAAAADVPAVADATRPVVATPAATHSEPAPGTYEAQSPDAPAAAAPVPTPAPVRVAADPPEGWEVVVGTSWLNKIGVVVFVVGLALLLGYSMANVGPLGRVAMGYALSLGMLGTGVAIERRDAYRNYAYGLIGGGWAGIYFTTYAMHALPAALVIESDVAGTLGLIAVAAGMIAHSLKYRSQALTGLAYVSAYAPLAFSPLSVFSLAATVPLTASLLIVASRFAWSGVAVLGLASTYAIFILRTSVVAVTPAAAALEIVPWIYWLMFEIADIAARRPARVQSAGADVRPAPLFVLNAAGFLGVILLDTRAGEAQWLRIGLAAAAYMVSALLRARLTSGVPASAAQRPLTTFTTTHGATAVAAALFAIAVDLRFSGTRQTIAWLVEAELIVAAGIALADRHIRRIGTAVAALTSAHVMMLLLTAFPASGFQSALGSSPVALLVAAAWYANREWLRRREVTLDAMEHLYTWVALFLALGVITHEVPDAYRGQVAVAWALLLLEAGFSRAREYRYQAYVAFVAGSILAGVEFLVDPLIAGQRPLARDIWIALPLVIAQAYLFAARLSKRAAATDRTFELRSFAAVASTIAIGFIAVLEWHTAPWPFTPALWTGTGACAAAFGAWKGAPAFRWQGYALAALGAVGPLADLLLRSSLPGPKYATAFAVIVFLYTTGYVGRSAASRTVSIESFAAGVIAFLGSVLQALFVHRAVPDDFVAPIWTASAAVLVTLGLRRSRAGQRWQGYLLFAASIVLMHQNLGDGGRDWTAVLAMAVAIFGTYATMVAIRPAIRALPTDAGPAGLEEAARVGLLVAATIVLSMLLMREAGTRMVTLAWALQGAALLVTGFATRERVLRLSGLALLFLCIAKLFAYDLQQLEALARILSFVVLGLVLLAVSWVYTRYREQIRRLL